jgi:uncharacterized protein (DUF2267 family)
MQYDELVRRTQQYAGFDSPDDAEQLINVFLATLGEPLPREASMSIRAQLPKELKEVVFETQPPETATRANDPIRLEEFYNRIKGRLDVPYNEGVRLSRVMARVLKEAVSDGEYRDMVGALPDDFRGLF